MSVDRKGVRKALLDRLKAQVPGVVFWSDRYLDFDQVPARPGICLAVKSQAPSQQKRVPTIWTIQLVASIHLQGTGTVGDSPDDTFDDFLSQIEDALRRQPGEDTSSSVEETTLGGRCIRCSISGEVVYWDAGAAGAQVVDVPIEIVVAP